MWGACVIVVFSPLLDLLKSRAWPLPGVTQLFTPCFALIAVSIDSDVLSEHNPNILSTMTHEIQWHKLAQTGRQTG
jgi:hypothetical protein